MEKSSKNYIPDPNEIEDALNRAFQKHVGGGGNRMKVDALAAEVGCSPSTIYSILSGQLTPGYALTMRCAAVLGPAFVNEFLSPLGMGGAHAVEDTAHGVIDIAGALSGGASSLLVTASDGRIDPKEAAQNADTLEDIAERAIEESKRQRSIAKSGIGQPIIMNNTGGK